MIFEQNDIRPLLERYSWEYSQLPDGKVVTGFKGKCGPFSIVFQIKDSWLTIIAPLTPDYLPIVEEKSKGTTYSYLLELNSYYPLIRFIVVQGDIAVVADLLIKNGQVDFELFKAGLDIMSEAVDKAVPQIYEKITGTKFVIKKDNNESQ